MDTKSLLRVGIMSDHHFIRFKTESALKETFVKMKMKKKNVFVQSTALECGMRHAA